VVKTLVTAATKHGATAEIAEVISQMLTQRGIEATILPPEDVYAIDEYEAVVLGSAVYAGHWLKPARELAHRLGPALSTRPVWLFSSGPIGDPSKPEEDPVDVAEIIEATKARDHRLFAGKLATKRLSFGERAIVLALRAPEGDFRDWEAIRAWASEIADVLQSGS
jgi:menaquinone-dependent protoporphyrinogen oxidase